MCVHVYSKVGVVLGGEEREGINGVSEIEREREREMEMEVKVHKHIEEMSPAQLKMTTVRKILVNIHVGRTAAGELINIAA